MLRFGSRAGRWPLALLVMMASGFAGLGYQIVWTQQCALWLGHESAAVLAVVTAFFGGLAVGAFVFGPRIESSTRPVWWYAGCELAIAAWSLLLALGLSSFSAWVLDMTGAQPGPAWQWAVAFFSTFLLLLPATAAMGATLPALERVTAQMTWSRGEGRSIAALYASNTFGATLGVVAIAFWLVPELGLLRTAVCCMGLNLLCAAASLALFSGPTEPALKPAASDPVVARGVLARLMLTGFLGIGYEVLVIRVLSEVAEDTVYTFAMLLAVYLVGSAVGAAGYQRWLARPGDSGKLGDKLHYTLAVACLIGTTSLWAAEHVKALVLEWFGVSMTAAISAEAVLALIAFGPPTVVMGALFSHLSARANASGISFGRALGVNTLGAAVAPLFFGVLALPWLGAKPALLLIALGYLALASWRAWRTPAVWAPAAVAGALAFLAPPLAFVDVPEGGRIVSYQEGIMAAVSVVEDAGGVARLRINNRQQEGSSSTLRVDARQAWLPLLLHPAPGRALFLGLGTGVTASSAAEDPTLHVDAVELLPEVIAASSHFTRALSDGASASRLQLIAADARRYVRTSDRHYDVIISDNFHPARSGSGSLYTVEHFAAVRDRLDVGGVFCQWLPLHQLDLETLRSIVQSFMAVFPEGSGMLASNSLDTPVLGLVGRKEGGRFAIDTTHHRLTNAALGEKLAGIGIEDEFAVLGSFIAGSESLRRFAGSAAINTDDHPVVAYRAPRITYVPDSLPRDRLIVLLEELSIEPAELLASADAALDKRLAAYWVARNLFIASGRDVRPSSDVRDMLAQAREPLLSALRISPDFRPAYDPLVLMANVLARTDAPAARALLAELLQAQPARREAELTLRDLDSAAQLAIE